MQYLISDYSPINVSDGQLTGRMTCELRWHNVIPAPIISHPGCWLPSSHRTAAQPSGPHVVRQDRPPERRLTDTSAYRPRTVYASVNPHQPTSARGLCHRQACIALVCTTVYVYVFSFFLLSSSRLQRADMWSA